MKYPNYSHNLLIVDVKCKTFVLKDTEGRDPTMVSWNVSQLWLQLSNIINSFGLLVPSLDQNGESSTHWNTFKQLGRQRVKVVEVTSVTIISEVS